MSYPTDFKQWLAKLISFDTTCTTKTTVACAQYIQGYLTSVGVKSELVYNEEKNKAHLWATLPGEDGSTQGGIIMSGHLDVVPVDGQKWDSDPFQMVEKDGKLFGRGACDMKGFIAVVLALTPRFLSMKRAKPIHYAWSYDEEMGCTGIPVLVDWLKMRNFKADACLVGDGSLTVSTGNKGHRVWRVTVHGKAIHSSMALMNTSCNAIEYASKIIAKIREVALDVRDNGPRDKSYGCPHSPVSVNLLKGGNAVNTVPAECEFEFNVRIHQTDVAIDVERRVGAYINDVIVPEMRKEYADARVDFVAFCSCPPFNADEAAPLTKLCRKLLNSHEITKGTGTTEAGFFQEALGIPTVIVGPGGAAAHEANEYTTAENMSKCTKFIMQLTEAYTAAGKVVGTHL